MAPRHLRSAFFLIVLSLPPAVAQGACSVVDPLHTPWTSILTRRVTDGAVDYASLQHEDRAALDAYLATLSGVCAQDYETWTKAAKIAFWINAYNAFTVKLILDHYPIASIRKIGWLPGAAFRERFIPMQGLKDDTISLNDIEHGTLRRAFDEPRIHFALVCASRSCPALRAEAYRAGDLDAQLDDQARTFLRDRAKNRFDAATRTLFLSSIFDWFHEDFERAAGSVPAFVGQYLDAKLEPDVRVEFLDYDWRLNDRSGARSPRPEAFR